jgi:negative regulator of flagellin synthesis FlgM
VANRITQLDGGTVGTSGNALDPARPSGPAGSAAASTNAASTPGEQVNITDSARALASLSDAVQQTPDIDQGRVASIQQALASGQYQVDPDRIAGRMLQLEQDLDGTQQQ